MEVESMLGMQDVSAARTDASELRERMAALSERIVALAEAANIVAEAAAPFRALPAANGNGLTTPSSFSAEPDGFKALNRAAARLEAARLAAVDEFTTVRRQLGDNLVQH